MATGGSLPPLGKFREFIVLFPLGVLREVWLGCLGLGLGLG